MWQIGGLGPMMGQAGHFRNAATEEVAYAKTRYNNETQRLLGVLDKQLEDKQFIAGDYSIADIACYPWIFAASGNYLGINLADYPNVLRWSETISKRPAVNKAYEIGQNIRDNA
jgi:GST-like protein